MTAPSLCPDCGTGLVELDRFCSGCGKGVVRCTACGAVGMAGDRFCGNCGSDLPASDDSPVPSIRTTAARPVVNPWEGILQRLKAATAGEYEILHELGRGGMAAVFLARELALTRHVAIKVMSPGVMMSEGMIERFHQEAVTVANLNHSNIITVHAVREFDDLHFFVMEFVAGRALDRVIADKGQLPIPVVRAIVAQVGSALAYAHRRGVIHRDIKPGNILLDSDGEAIVTDFGIAKVMTSTSQTVTGAVHGTAAYMSPEQCYAAPLTSASDQYSLGVVAYEMLAGKPPFSADSAFALMQAHTTADVPSLIERRPDCPPDLAEAVLRMLAKKPEDRWPNMNAALSALRAFPVSPEDPVREELVRLADPGGVALGDVIQTPMSPIPKVGRRTPGSTPAKPVVVSGPSAATTRPTIQIEPPTMALEVGDTAVARAIVRGRQSSPTSDNVVWTTTSDKVVRVDRRTGAITAESPGKARVTASLVGVETSIEVTVEPATVAAVKIGPANTAPIVGDRLQLAATATDKAGRRLQRTISWSTSGPEIGSISSSGELTLHAPGPVTVVASCDLQRDEITLTVRPQPVAHVEIINAPSELTVGGTVELHALARDAHRTALHGRSPAWSSSDRSVATVSASGVVTAHEAGTVTITVKCEGKTAAARLTVNPSPLTTVAVTTPVRELSPKQRVRLTAVGTDARGNKLQLKPRWRSSDSAVATVSDKGDVTAIAPGSVTITARADGIEGTVELGVAAPVMVTPTADRTHGVVTHEEAVAPTFTQPPARRFPTRAVAAGIGGLGLLGIALYVLLGTPSDPVDPPGGQQPRITTPRSVALSEPPAVVRVGDTFPLVATVRGGDTTTTSPTQWESLTPAARVEASSGEVVALAAGQAMIVATNGTAKDTAAFDIVAATGPGSGPVTVASLEVQMPPGTGAMQVGDRITPRAVAFDSAHVQTRGGAVSWSSSDPRVATVDSRTGEVTAVAAGSARIIARGDSRRAEATVVVQPPTVRDVVISGPDQLQSGESAQLTATARDARSHEIPDASIAWSSANRAVVQVDATTGRLRGGDAGQAVITASVGTVTATKVIVVTKRTDIVDSPPPKHEPTPEELLRAGEAGIRGAVEGYARELGARNFARVQSLYDPITDEDRKNLDALRTLIRDRGLTLVRFSVGDPRLESRRVLVDLSTRLKWKGFAAANTERAVPFLATFELTNGEWRLVSCRVVGNPGLT